MSITTVNLSFFNEEGIILFQESISYAEYLSMRKYKEASIKNKEKNKNRYEKLGIVHPSKYLEEFCKNFIIENTEAITPLHLVKERYDTLYDVDIDTKVLGKKIRKLGYKTKMIKKVCYVLDCSIV